jgi:gamma-glutamyltranspeptidase/glutathione hydrolase
MRGRRHMAVAGHYLAAQAALQILESGGNAIDAGVASGLVLSVVHSEYVNFAGVAPIMIYRAETGKVETISGLGTWPRAVTPDMFQREHGGEIPEGILRTVVPAAPCAWISALQRHGILSFAEAAEPAIAYAAGGFVMYPFMANILASHEEEYARWPSSAEIYLPGGAAPEVGDIFVQRDLVAPASSAR